MHYPFRTASGLQNSRPWDPWLPVVKALVLPLTWAVRVRGDYQRPEERHSGRSRGESTQLLMSHSPGTLGPVATGGGKQPPFRTARAQRTVRPPPKQVGPPCSPPPPSGMNHQDRHATLTHAVAPPPPPPPPHLPHPHPHTLGPRTTARTPRHRKPPQSALPARPVWYAGTTIRRIPTPPNVQNRPGSGLDNAAPVSGFKPNDRVVVNEGRGWVRGGGHQISNGACDALFATFGGSGKTGVRFGKRSTELGAVEKATGFHHGVEKNLLQPTQYDGRDTALQRVFSRGRSTLGLRHSKIWGAEIPSRGGRS